MALIIGKGFSSGPPPGYTVVRPNLFIAPGMFWDDKYVRDAQVYVVCYAEKLTRDDFHKMVHSSAKNSQRPPFNRRYHDWALQVEERIKPDGKPHTRVVRMAKFHMVEFGTGPDFVDEEHAACSGAGCKVCGWNGFRRRRIK